MMWTAMGVASLLYMVSGVVLFALLPVRRAVAASYLAGWLLLPVGIFPPDIHGFSVELIGAALPAQNMPVTKAWVAPMTTLVLALAFTPGAFARWRPGWIDAPMLLWCLWPLIAGLGTDMPAPTPAVASAYLAGVWGAPWLLGRVFFADAAGRRTLIEAIANAGLLLVPAAIVEGIGGPVFYPLLYGEHPFLTDGIGRYIGYRPLLLTEDGNQYGMVIAMTALAGVAAWRIEPTRARAARAVMLAAMAALSQSAGAIALGVLGTPVVLGLARPAVLRRLLVAGAALVAIGAPVYLSGAVPVERLIRHTGPGQRVLAMVRATGRGSFAWRISQDQKVLPIVHAHPIVGSSRWDWWRPVERRPWGLALLIVGQFGLVALGLWAMIWVAPFGWRVFGTTNEAALALTLIAALSALDGLLNAFVFLPAVMTAAAGAWSRDDRRTVAPPHHRL